MSLLILKVSKSFQFLLCAFVILALTTKSPHCASQILPLPFTNLSPFGVIFLCWLPILVKDQQISQNGPVQRRSNHLSCLFFYMQRWCTPSHLLAMWRTFWPWRSLSVRVEFFFIQVYVLGCCRHSSNILKKFL